MQNPAPDSGNKISPKAEAGKAYNAAGFAPLWLDEDGRAIRADSLLADLEALRWDGLSPERYGLATLREQSVRLRDADATALAAFDTACTGAYLRAAHDLLLGALSPRRADSLWFVANDSAWNAEQILTVRDTYPSLDSFRSALPAYRALRSELQRLNELAADSNFLSYKTSLAKGGATDSLLAFVIDKESPATGGARPDGADTLSGLAAQIARYQWRHGLKPTGRADSATRKLLARHPDSAAARVRANLERIRWMPRTMPSKLVMVVVPQMELAYLENGRAEMEMRVVVGRPSRQTPSLAAPMANIVFNPPWGVPPTILKNDVLPGLLSRGGGYLARKGLVAYDRRGRPVSAGVITASNYRSYTFRQPPGARNALGEVKFNMPNKWDIYLHDTPHREDFPKRNRALSSGCVRIAEPKEFAEFILTKLEGKSEYDQFLIDSLIQTRQTKSEPLKEKLPVFIVYLTATHDGAGGVRYLEDIYKRDRKLVALTANI